jgi:Stress up-regulated Nod 19
MGEGTVRRSRPWKMVVLLAVGAVVLALAPHAVAATKTVRYGPYTIPGGSMDMPGMVHNKLSFGIPRPCSSCYITSFRPDLQYADGRSANFDTGAMLHHIVFTSQFRSDATCSGTVLGLAGERFFASGNERTRITLPSGYGYRLRWWDSWNLLVDLMNMEPESQTVYVTVTYTYKSAWSNLKPVKPVWLDIDNCHDSEYAIASGYSETSWTWTSTLTGNVVAALGHVHDYGVRVIATDQTSGKTICTSVAGYGSKPAYMGHIESMSTCTGTPLATVKTGDVLRLTSIYDSPEARDDVMGIMLLYLHRTG